MNEPLETIYINNLNQKVSINTLVRELRRNYEKYGNIVQISAHKSLTRKGQAFVTFDNLESSKRAVNESNDTVIIDTKVRVDFAHANSDNYYVEIAKQPIEDRKRARAESRKGQKKPKLKEWQSVPANNILLCQNLKADLSPETLNSYFEQFNGFINSRYVKIRNLAFLEFDNVTLSTECLNNVNQQELIEKFGESVFLTYAKK